jgi:DNA-binding MarR family transcriptional regulator
LPKPFKSNLFSSLTEYLQICISVVFEQYIGENYEHSQCRPTSHALVERLHRLLLDVIKDEFERVNMLEINAVQALLLFNIGDNEVTAGELKSRGYYQGSNVSYNLKKLVEMGYMHHQRCEIDRRSVRVKLTQKGRDVHDIVSQLFERHAEGLQDKGVLGPEGLIEITGALKRMERYWTDQILYIY